MGQNYFTKLYYMDAIQALSFFKGTRVYSHFY